MEKIIIIKVETHEELEAYRLQQLEAVDAETSILVANKAHFRVLEYPNRVFNPKHIWHLTNLPDFVARGDVDFYLDRLAD